MVFGGVFCVVEEFCFGEDDVFGCFGEGVDFDQGGVVYCVGYVVDYVEVVVDGGEGGFLVFEGDGVVEEEGVLLGGDGGGVGE